MGGGRHTDRDDRVEEADGDADIANGAFLFIFSGGKGYSVLE